MGHARAQNNLATCFTSGMGVKQDLSEAVRYAKLAADQNDPAALFSLSIAYFLGGGVEEDFKTGLHYLKLAINQKSDSAIKFLNVLNKYKITDSNGLRALNPKFVKCGFNMILSFPQIFESFK